MKIRHFVEIYPIRFLNQSSRELSVQFRSISFSTKIKLEVQAIFRNHLVRAKYLILSFVLLTHIQGFFFQTPLDGDLFYSYASCSFHNYQGNDKYSRVLLVSNRLTDFEIEGSLPSIPFTFRSTDIPTVMIPLKFLRHHVRHTSEQLAILLDQVKRVEQIVSTETALGIQTLRDQTRQLHACDMELIRLERRWRFQAELAFSIQEFLDSYKKATINNLEVNIGSLSISERGVMNIENHNSDGRTTLDSTDFRNSNYFRALDIEVGF